MNIYVGNLAEDVTEDELHDAFAEYGEVSRADLIKDKFTGMSRGFGFIEMPSKEEAQAAISALNGTKLKGKTLTVNEARPKAAAGGGGRGGGGRGGRW